MHRLRHAARTQSFNAPLAGVNEMDSTFVGGKEANKHQDKRTPGSQGGAGKAVVLGILTDKLKTGFFFVVIPEAGISNDTQKAARMFAQFDVPVAGYVVNRVIPHELLGQNIPEYLRRRIAMQDQHLRDVRTAFDDQVIALVPEMDRDVTGLPMIEKLADIMFA